MSKEQIRLATSRTFSFPNHAASYILELLCSAPLQL